MLVDQLMDNDKRRELYEDFIDQFVTVADGVEMNSTLKNSLIDQMMEHGFEYLTFQRAITDEKPPVKLSLSDLNILRLALEMADSEKMLDYIMEEDPVKGDREDVERLYKKSRKKLLKKLKKGVKKAGKKAWKKAYEEAALLEESLGLADDVIGIAVDDEGHVTPLSGSVFKL